MGGHGARGQVTPGSGRVFALGHRHSGYRDAGAVASLSGPGGLGRPVCRFPHPQHLYVAQNLAQWLQPPWPGSEALAPMPFSGKAFPSNHCCTSSPPALPFASFQAGCPYALCDQARTGRADFGRESRQVLTGLAGRKTRRPRTQHEHAEYAGDDARTPQVRPREMLSLPRDIARPRHQRGVRRGSVAGQRAP